MSTAVDPPRKRRFLHVSLRTLLLLTLTFGTIGGLYGPDIVRLVKQWRTAPAPPPPPNVAVPPWVQLREQDESNGYFESAETPLR